MDQARTHGSSARASSIGSNDTVKAAISTAPRAKICSLWIHDESYAKDEVLLDLDLLGPGAIKAGDLVKVATVAPGQSDTRDFQTKAEKDGRNGAADVLGSLHEPRSQRRKDTGSTQAKDRRRYVFVVKSIPDDVKQKATGLAISLTSTIANAFAFRKGDQVSVSLADQYAHTASHVEIVFRDIYLSRADMWRLVLAELCESTIYKGQKLIFLGTIKATIKTIYARGRKVSSAYFSPSTIPIFRSESARYVLFIQMSREMWDFDSEGTGEIMFSRVIDGFLPELFKRWAELEAKHLVSIVLFGRLEFDRHQLLSLGQLHSTNLQNSHFGSGRTKYKDFYRVVVSDMASGQWTAILNALKREFRIFLRDISIQVENIFDHPEANHIDKASSGKPRISGRPSSALRGNILEAINIAASQFGKDYIDRDLVRTGISIVVVTPGPGVFEVDRDLLELTSQSLTNNGIGIDLVCLSKMPLHSVPLFKYRATPKASEQSSRIAMLSGKGPDPRPVPGSVDANRVGVSPSTLNAQSSTPRSTSALRAYQNVNNWLYGIPQWIDVSFWSADNDAGQVMYGITWDSSRATYLDTKFTKAFVPQVRMYELQMMGVMETGLANISVSYLSEGPQGLQRAARGVQFRRNLEKKSSYRYLISLSSSQRSQPAFPERGESPQSTRKGARGLQAAHAQTSRHKFEKMDEYDQNLFRVQPRHSDSVRRIKKKRAHEEQIVTAVPNFETEKRLPLSRIPSERSGKIEVDKQQGALDQDSLSSRPKPGPVQRTTSSRVSRSISFAFKGLGSAAPRALASTSVKFENISAAGISRGDTTSNKLPASVTVRSPEAPRPKTVDRLSADPESSDNSDSSRSTTTQEASSRSRPISIKRSLHTLGKGEPADGESRSYSAATTDIDGVHSDTAGLRSNTTSDDETYVSKSPSAATAAMIDQRSMPGYFCPGVKNVNPSNPSRNNPNATLSFGRWQHIFPRTPRASTVKWRSLCTPASVPLTTEVFPSRFELENDYVQTPYSIQQEVEPDVVESPKTRETLIREMIALRLAHGYQVVVGPTLADVMGLEICDSSQLFDEKELAQDGNVLFMSMGNTIQRLAFTDERDIQVTKFVREVRPDHKLIHLDYVPSIRTILSPLYLARPIHIGGYSDEYPWSLADAFLAGQKGYHAQTAEQLRFWRARFVLIPVEPPPNARRAGQNKAHDTEEEIHLTGIRWLTQLWQKNRHVPIEERGFKSKTGSWKDPNPLDIIFATRNPSEIVTDELYRLIEADAKGESRPTQLLPESELFSREQVNLEKLAQAIQSDKGVEIVSRRWHFRMHWNCFIGSDMTTWLVQNFRDIETREEAVETGNKLMNSKLFQHVEQRHPFRDGNYFYQIAQEHRAPRPESKSSWFPGRKAERSIPSTPINENVSRDSPLGARSRSSSATNLEALSRETTTSTPTKGVKARHSVSLSNVMKVDVDPRNRSSRPELVDLHYDRLHNPENCYHIELSWINVTSKLVEDSIVNWATNAEKYGLKIVEVPIQEVSSISHREPFRSPYHVRLASMPPVTQSALTYFNSTSLAPQPGTPDKHYHQKRLLKKFNFVLDLEAAADFTSDVDVTYSWGVPHYQYPQYIHRSGVLLAQINDDGHFLFLANRLYNTRSAYSKDLPNSSKVEAQAYDYGDFGGFHRRPPPPAQHPTQLHSATLASKPMTASGRYQSPTRGESAAPNSPHPSPLVRASSDVLGNRETLSASSLSSYITPEQIKDEFEYFCGDIAKLEQFYNEVATPAPAATTPAVGATPSSGRGTGRLAATTPLIIEEKSNEVGFDGAGLESSIPSLVLPSSVVGSPVLTSRQQHGRVGTQNNTEHYANKASPSSRRRDSEETPATPSLLPSQPTQSSSTSDTAAPTTPKPRSSSPSSSTTASLSAQSATDVEQKKRNSHAFPPSPAISAISAAIEERKSISSPKLMGRDSPLRKGGGVGD